MRKLLALSILVSTVLTGCGSGGSDSGSSGSSSAPAVQKYTFEFVQMVETGDSIPTACTIFDVEGQKPDVKTYAKVASDVMVKVYNADGSFAKVLTVANNGVLTFAKNDIEDGGYISIIDSPSNSDHFYKVLSIQKELLGNYVININRNQGDVACYQDGKGLATETGFASVVPNGITLNGYGFETSHTSIAGQADPSIKLEAYSNEKAFAKAYNNGDLVGYAFVDQLTKNIYDLPTLLDSTDTTPYQWHISLPDNELDKITIRLANGDYSYPWYEPVFNKANGVTTDFPYASTESNWFYSVTGTTTKKWKFVQNGALQANLDVNLPSSLDLSDNDSEISQVGDSFVFQAKGVNATETIMQRSHYFQSYNSNAKTLDHSIYSLVEKDADVIIPDLELANLDPNNQVTKDVSVLEASVINSEFIESYLRHYQGIDLVSVVMTPADRITHQKAMQMSNYTLAER